MLIELVLSGHNIDSIPDMEELPENMVRALLVLNESEKDCLAFISSK